MASFLRRGPKSPKAAESQEDFTSGNLGLTVDVTPKNGRAPAKQQASDALCLSTVEIESKDSFADLISPMTPSALSPSSRRSKSRSRWTKSEREALQSLDFFNETQRKALEEMRENCASDLAAAGLSIDEGAEADIVNVRMLRFLRGHKFDMKTACQMYTDMVAWRKAESIDAIREEIKQSELRPADFPHHGRVVRFLPVHHDHGFDLQGRPIQIELLGRIDTKKLLSSFHEKEFLRHHIYSMEYTSMKIERLSQERQTLVRTVLIFDLAGLGMSHMHKPAMDLLQKALKITQDYYPESMHCCYIINAPKVFSVLWQVIKPLLAERTVRKIQVLGSSYTSELLKSIPPDSIPASLGGGRADEWPLVFDKAEASRVNDDYETLTLAKGESRTLKILVASDSYVAWGFYVHAGDISFACAFEEHASSSQDRKDSASAITQSEHNGKHESLGNSFDAPRPGTLLLTFDNSSSWIKGKTISYYVCVAPRAVRHELDSPRNGRLRQFFTDSIN